MCISVTFFSLSLFDVSLCTTRSNIAMRKCNAISIMLCRIAFDIVHVVRLYSNWEEDGLLSKRISSSLCNISFQTYWWNKTHRWGIVVKTWVLNHDPYLRLGLPMFTANWDYKSSYMYMQKCCKLINFKTFQEIKTYLCQYTYNESITLVLRQHFLIHSCITKIYNL